VNFAHCRLRLEYIALEALSQTVFRRFAFRMKFIIGDSQRRAKRWLEQDYQRELDPLALDFLGDQIATLLPNKAAKKGHEASASTH
jgi:hypothetical protein